MTVGVRSDLEELILQNSGWGRPIFDGTELWHDVGVGGDDAMELLEYVHGKYGTRFDSLEFGDYFPNESMGLLWLAWKKRLGFSDTKHKSFTFGHLLAVVHKGQWFDPA